MVGVDALAAGACRRLDLDRQETSAGLDDQVHLLADGGSPVEDFGVLQACVAPSEKVVEHEVLEVCAIGGTLQENSVRKTEKSCYS